MRKKGDVSATVEIHLRMHLLFVLDLQNCNQGLLYTGE